MDFYNKEKGITLMTLVITIIILLILVGISISVLISNNLLENANEAKKNTIQAQYEEELNMIIISMQADSIYSEKDFNMTYIIENLPEYLERENNNDYKWEINQILDEPTGEYKGYSFFIDKNFVAHINKSDMSNIEKSKKFIYDKGKKYEEFVIVSQRNTNYNLNDFNYIDINSLPMNYNGININTKDLIQITGYKKIVIKATVDRNIETGGYVLGIGNSPNGDFEINNDGFSHSTDVNYDVGEDVSIILDISEIEGSYYIGLKSASYSIKIHQMWLE